MEIPSLFLGTPLIFMMEITLLLPKMMKENQILPEAIN